MTQQTAGQTTGQRHYVMYHAGCLDGFGAAWAAHTVLGDDNVDYLPASYGKPLPNFRPGSRIFILDFSYPRETMLELIQHHEVTVLDHHETAEEAIGDLPGCRYDCTRSGAILAWQHFQPGAPAPEMLRYVEDRDLWKFELPHSREVDAALRSFPADFGTWSALDDLPCVVDELAAQGHGILRSNHRMAEMICANTVMVEICGHQTPTVNTPVLASEACEMLLEREPGCQVLRRLPGPGWPAQVEPAQPGGQQFRCLQARQITGRGRTPPRRRLHPGTAGTPPDRGRRGEERVTVRILTGMLKTSGCDLPGRRRARGDAARHPGFSERLACRPNHRRSGGDRAAAPGERENADHDRDRPGPGRTGLAGP